MVVPPQYEQYLKYSKLAHEIYYRYTDLVEPFGMDECWLDVTGSGIFGTGMEIAEQIRKTIREELGLTVSIGVSFNKVFAKLGSDMKKPDAITQFRLDFDCYGCVWNFETASGRREAVRVATNGTRFTKVLGTLEDVNQLYLCDGFWPEENVFQMHCRWLETCLQDVYTLRFEGSRVTITAENNSPFQWKKPEPITAVQE